MRIRRGRAYAALTVTRRALALLLVVGCRPSVEPSPAKANANVDAAAPPVVVASVASSVAPPLAPPVAVEEPKEDLEEIAKAMCAASYREDEGTRIVGCRRPPPFEGKGRAPDGKIVRFADQDVMTFCGISIGARGSFSAPDKKELLVTIENCRDVDRDEGWNGSMPGSAAIVASEDGRFRRVAVTSGVNTAACLVLHRSDGRDTLMCKSRYDAGSIGTDYYFFSLDFAGGKPVARTVAHLFDDADLWTCMAHDGQSTMAPTGITGLKIVGTTPRDVNGDGTPDVVIDVERAHAEPSPALETKLRALCKQGKPIDSVLPAPLKHQIELVSEAKGFRPAPASKKLLDKWRAESPDVTQLEGAAPPKIDR